MSGFGVEQLGLHVLLTTKKVENGKQDAFRIFTPLILLPSGLPCAPQTLKTSEGLVQTVSATSPELVKPVFLGLS